MAVLMEAVLNQVLQSEMSDHLGAEPGERTAGRRGYRNGSYERELTRATDGSNWKYLATATARSPRSSSTDTSARRKRSFWR